MRIGVVSDTHNNLKNVAKIVELFNAEEVDRVVHTGDITQAKTIEILARLTMPVQGVFGNNDQERESLEAAIAAAGFAFCDPPLKLTWHEREIIVVHDPLEFDGHMEGPEVERPWDLALHGHTHRHRHETLATTTYFNPGECAGHMSGYNRIGIYDLATMEAEILKF